ncbi:Replication protein A 70 kDa DNA-binding subunit B [Camellia lanceoleosa]|nr:Replication protein A 70 kDa DNA-binding subunit B [Camellia lanceoleosa]
MKKNFKDHKDEETPLQEIIVINDQLKPTTLTLWGECVAFFKFPSPFLIIIAMRLKVSSYNGITLSTKSSTTFILDPSIPEANSLKAW